MIRRYAIMTVLIITLLTLTIFTSESIAGWVEVNRLSGTAYISKSMVKQVPQSEGEPWSLFDASRGTITLVQPRQKSYMEIDPEELCSLMASMMGLMGR